MKIKTPKHDKAVTSTPTMEVIENRTRSTNREVEMYGIEEELDPLFETEMILMAKEMETF